MPAGEMPAGEIFLLEIASSNIESLAETSNFTPLRAVHSGLNYEMSSIYCKHEVFFNVHLRRSSTCATNIGKMHGSIRQSLTYKWRICWLIISAEAWELMQRKHRFIQQALMWVKNYADSKFRKPLSVFPCIRDFYAHLPPHSLFVNATKHNWASMSAMTRAIRCQVERPTKRQDKRQHFQCISYKSNFSRLAHFALEFHRLRYRRRSSLVHHEDSVCFVGYCTHYCLDVR